MYTKAVQRISCCTANGKEKEQSLHICPLNSPEHKRYLTPMRSEYCSRLRVRDKQTFLGTTLVRNILWTGIV